MEQSINEIIPGLGLQNIIEILLAFLILSDLVLLLLHHLFLVHDSLC